MTDLRGAQRGLGSGIPANQAVIGARDPKRAAAMAVGQNLKEEEKEQDAHNTKLRRMELIMEAITEGFITDFSPGELKDLTEERFDKLWERFEAWEDKKIDDEIAFEYSVSPDDPLYDPIKDTKRRKQIESQLKPLDFESMIFEGYCTQEIPIRNNFIVRFRSLNTNQSLWIESMTLDIREQSIQYGRHWIALVQVAVCLESINGQEIAPRVSKFKKSSDEEDFKRALKQRMEHIGAMPQIITDDLIIQYAWFSARVRRMLSGDMVDKLGNS